MFTIIKTTKVYEQVIIQIKKMVADETLQRGDKLPSERELSARLKVSRASIREALRALQVIGLIECKQGEGNFIKKNFENSLFEPLSVMFMLNKSTTNEILELRRVIEIETAALAAKSITDEELIELKEILDKMRSSSDEELKVRLDKEFHYKIAKASRNFLIVTILNTISSLIDSFIKGARKKILDNIDNEGVIEEQHKFIYDALKNHNAQEAAVIMRKHMDLINEYFIKVSK